MTTLNLDKTDWLEGHKSRVPKTEGPTVSKCTRYELIWHLWGTIKIHSHKGQFGVLDGRRKVVGV
jgi:hypothetical protein